MELQQLMKHDAIERAAHADPEQRTRGNNWSN
jgi:hypothetical protein